MPYINGRSFTLITMPSGSSATAPGFKVPLDVPKLDRARRNGQRADIAMFVTRLLKSEVPAGIRA
jgi:hypothetical protein